MTGYGNNTFQYGADGIRCRKNNVHYTLDGSRILQEYHEDTGETLTFYYGEKGVFGFRYRDANGAENDYFYRKNLFGDVLAIYNANGQRIANYRYDAWGYHIPEDDDDENLAIKNINPFRYRSYYYDTETCLYYLESRYYDPELCRFLNPDTIDYLGDGEELHNYNLFAYCGNNPVMRTDPSGHVILETLFDIFSLIVSGIDLLSDPKDPVRVLGFLGDLVDLVPTLTGVGESVRFAKLQSSSDDLIKKALRELDGSGIRPGQTEIRRSRVMWLVDNYNTTKAHSAIFTNRTGIQYVSDGHHTIVASTILGKKGGINMGLKSYDPPLSLDIYWTKKWYEFNKKAIKIVD